MTEQTSVVGGGLGTAPVARSVALGMFLMAFFTVLWASWIPYGLPVLVAVPLLGLFVALAPAYVFWGVRLFRAAGRFPRPDAAAGVRGRRLQVGFGVIVGIESLVIAGLSAVLGIRGADAYFGPAIALVVGLHFLPFGPLFHRRVDYYIGGWVCLGAVTGLWLLHSGRLAPALVGSLVAVATAAGTTAYGLYQRRLARTMLTSLNGGAVG